jgi:hypothetical protein
VIEAEGFRASGDVHPAHRVRERAFPDSVRSMRAAIRHASIGPSPALDLKRIRGGGWDVPWTGLARYVYETRHPAAEEGMRP